MVSHTESFKLTVPEIIVVEDCPTDFKIHAVHATDNSIHAYQIDNMIPEVVESVEPVAFNLKTIIHDLLQYPKPTSIHLQYPKPTSVNFQNPKPIAFTYQLNKHIFIYQLHSNT